jgi:hypothetical protein
MICHSCEIAVMMPEQAEQIAHLFEVPLGSAITYTELFTQCREWHDKCCKITSTGCVVDFCQCDHLIRIDNDLFNL